MKTADVIHWLEKILACPPGELNLYAEERRAIAQAIEILRRVQSEDRSERRVLAEGKP